MPTLTAVPSRPVMPTAYEEKRQQYLDHCAQLHGKAQHYEDILYTVLCNLTDTITDPVQLWQEAERTAAIRIESHPRWVSRQFVAPTQPDSEFMMVWDALLLRYYALADKASENNDYSSLDEITQRLSEMMDRHELLYGKMKNEVVINGYGMAKQLTNLTAH